jgi:hypothetical protein
MSFDASTVTAPLEGFHFPATSLASRGFPMGGKPSESDHIALLQSMIQTLTTVVGDLARVVERMDSQLAQLRP